MLTGLKQLANLTTLFYIFCFNRLNPFFMIKVITLIY